MRKFVVVVLPLALLGAAIGAEDDSAAAKQGWLGVYSENLSEPVLIALDLEHGVVVTQVSEDSPAEDAGLARGDVIVSVDGQDVEDAGGLRRIVRKRPDKSVTITIARRGKKRNLDARLAAREKLDVTETMNEMEWFGLPGEALREARRAIVNVGPGVERKIEAYTDGLDDLRAELRALRRELDSLRAQMKQK
jgi:serine protease Do